MKLNLKEVILKENYYSKYMWNSDNIMKNGVLSPKTNTFTNVVWTVIGCSGSNLIFSKAKTKPSVQRFCPTLETSPALAGLVCVSSCSPLLCCGIQARSWSLRVEPRRSRGPSSHRAIQTTGEGTMWVQVNRWKREIFFGPLGLYQLRLGTDQVPFQNDQWTSQAFADLDRSTPPNQTDRHLPLHPPSTGPGVGEGGVLIPLAEHSAVIPWSVKL